jgi:hypothetical protein
LYYIYSTFKREATKLGRSVLKKAFAMKTDSLTSVAHEVKFVARGNQKVFELAADLAGELTSPLGALGFSECNDSETPPSIRNEPTGDLAVLGLTIFVGSSVGSWLVGKLCDEVFEGHIRPAFKRAWSKLNNGHQDNSRPIIFTFNVEYEHSDTLVEVRCKCSSLEDLEVMIRLIPEAHKKVLECDSVQTSMIFQIQDGVISPPNSTSRLVANGTKHDPSLPTSD